MNAIRATVRSLVVEREVASGTKPGEVKRRALTRQRGAPFSRPSEAAEFPIESEQRDDEEGDGARPAQRANGIGEHRAFSLIRRRRLECHKR